MTEIGIAAINPPSGENRIGSIGKLCPGFEMSLRDDAGAEVPVGTPGRLWIRSPTNTIGYWQNPEATAETIVDGWLDTGDVMRVDADGYLWFCGRKKQIIVHDGSNICPQEVEEALQEHPAIEAAGVIGIHDLVHGENVRAYVTLKARRLPTHQRRANPVRPPARRLQSPRRDRHPRHDAAQRHRQSRPRRPQATGRRPSRDDHRLRPSLTHRPLCASDPQSLPPVPGERLGEGFN